MTRSVSINKVSKTGSEPGSGYPFPGLRPFNLKEKHLFYGRDGQSEHVLDLLTRNRFVAILGPSGSGKSSLVNCGVIPQLYGGYLYEAGSRWKIARMHPGYSPVESLAHTLTETFSTSRLSEDEIESEANLNYVLFTKKALEISKLVKKLKGYKDENILIFIDQFEELFRFTAGLDIKDSDIDESLLLINLLIEALKQDRVPIYVAICIRSDFVGSCTTYQALTEHINQSHYLVPQMMRDAYRSAIMGPLSLAKTRINPDVLQEILNSIGERADQLPVLQHMMMRVYNYWKAKGSPDQPINIYDYKAIGGLVDAISLHAEELYGALSDSEKNTCKKLFQTITESGGDNKGIRRPTSITNIARVSKSNQKEVIKIANIFRDEGNSLITPDISEEITPESVLDISHEAVMRNWKRLKKWIEEESDAVQLYLRLVEASDLYQSGKSGVWRPPELFLAINWRDKFKPNEVWASQYHPAFMRSVKFLEISDESYQEEEAEKERAKEREIRRTRWFTIGLAIVTVLSIVFMFNSFHLKSVAEDSQKEAEEQRQLADLNAAEADKQKNIALQYAEELEIQKAIVEDHLIVAVDEREYAVRTADDAVRQTNLVEANLEVARGDVEVLARTAEDERTQRERAERERLETYRENMVLLAQTLSSKSLDYNDDEELQALVAYQAYKFNQQFSGPEYHAGIYHGLREALTSLNVRYQVNLPGHTESVRSIVYGPRRGSLFSAGSDGKLLRWSRFTGNPQSEEIIDNSTINRILALSRNEKWLACGSEGLGIQLFDLQNLGAGPSVMQAHQNMIRSLAMFNDNQYMLSSGTDNTILKWELDRRRSEVFAELNSPAQSIAISGDDRFVAAGTKNGKLLLFSADGGKPPTVLLDEPGNQILTVVFQTRTNMLIAGDQRGIIRIWSLNFREQIYSKKLHQARIVEIKLDPSERYLATSSTDGRVYLIDTRELNSPAIEVIRQEGFIFSVAFIDEGENLIVGSNNTSPLVGYPLSIHQLANRICPNISRNMSTQEWINIVGEDVAYEETCSR